MNTVTWVGMDVHARSTHAAAINLLSGEIERCRFGPGVDAPVAWLAQLPGPVHACYEAGPTGYGLYRAAVAAGIRVDVVAPGKTPRGPSDRVKTDRKDAELLARLLSAGQLKAVTVPPAGVEAARELTRLHDACRRDLMSARHRLSKMLLRHGRVYPKPTTWKQDHRRWLAGQHFDDATSELVYLDLLARVDALTARKLQGVNRSEGPQPSDGRPPSLVECELRDMLVDPHRALDPSRAWSGLAAIPESTAPGCLAWIDPVTEPVW